MRGKWLIILLALILFVQLASSASTPAYRTIEYRGVASNNGAAVSDGTAVSIWANNGTLKMHEVLTQGGIGYYDHLEIAWDNLNTTGVDEGVYPDEVTLEEITFKVGGVNVTNPPNATVKISQRGNLVYLNLDTNLSDLTVPTVNLVSPDNNSIDADGGVSFQYNVTDNSNIANCTLSINGMVNETQTSPPKDTINSFNKTLVDGSYNWQVNCTDSYLNNGSSEIRILTVNTSLVTYVVNVTPWETLVSGKPTGVNVSVAYTNGTGVNNATVDAVEVNGYTAFALPQRIDSNVTSIVTARTYTNGNGFVMFTIAPTGGSGLIGSEDKVGNYSIYVDVTVGGALVNRTYLNNTERDLKDATGVVGAIPSRTDIVTFHNFLAVVYDKVNDWLI